MQRETLLERQQLRRSQRLLERQASKEWLDAETEHVRLSLQQQSLLKEETRVSAALLNHIHLCAKIVRSSEEGHEGLQRTL